MPFVTRTGHDDSVNKGLAGLCCMLIPASNTAPRPRNRWRRAVDGILCSFNFGAIQQISQAAVILPHGNSGLRVGCAITRVSISAPFFPLSRIPQRSGIQERDFLSTFFLGGQKESGCPQSGSTLASSHLSLPPHKLRTYFPPSSVALVLFCQSFLLAFQSTSSLFPFVLLPPQPRPKHFQRLTITSPL